MQGWGPCRSISSISKLGKSSLAMVREPVFFSRPSDTRAVAYEASHGRNGRAKCRICSQPALFTSPREKAGLGSFAAVVVAFSVLMATAATIPAAPAYYVLAVGALGVVLTIVTFFLPLASKKEHWV